MRAAPGVLLLTLALVVATGCGSSSDPAAPHTFVHATVDATGGLAVGGVPFGTRGAVLRYLDDGRNVMVGDVPAAVTFLAGTVVAVRGAIDRDRSGAAEEVLVRSVLRGPLQGRGEAALAVAGADVVLDSRTLVLDGNEARSSIEALPGGAPLEVHGFPERGARVRATLVRVLPTPAPILVHGWTLGVPEGGSFDLSLVRGGAPILRVDAAAAAPATPVPANALVRVTASGVAAGAPPVLIATSVAVVAQLLPIGEDRALVEGLVGGGSPDEFALGDHRVRATAATAYEGVPPGISAEALLTPGVRLVAEGARDRGVVVAERIRFVDVLRLAGRIDPGSLAISNPGGVASFTVGGEIVVADATTRATSAGAELTLTQLVQLHAAEAAGLPVALLAYRRADGAIQAQRIDVVAR